MLSEMKTTTSRLANTNKQINIQIYRYEICYLYYTPIKYITANNKYNINNFYSTINSSTQTLSQIY